MIKKAAPLDEQRWYEMVVDAIKTDIIHARQQREPRIEPPPIVNRMEDQEEFLVVANLILAKSALKSFRENVQVPTIMDSQWIDDAKRSIRTEEEMLEWGRKNYKQ